jgi:hypothetical protein
MQRPGTVVTELSHAGRNDPDGELVLEVVAVI